MNYAIDRIILDVHSSACQGTLRWKQGDTARRIVASFAENGKPWEFQSDCEISFYIKKPDGTVVWGYCTNPNANAAGSVIYYDIIGDETVIPGKLECEFRVYSNGKLLTSPRFNVIVDETVYNEDAIYSENRETFLTESVNKMISATAEAKAVSNEVQTKLDNGEFDGKDGKDGTDGKSAYEYAVEGGYSESEETFYEDLGRVHNDGGGADLSDDLPLMNGTASPGVSKKASRIDHVHPTDTSRMPAIEEMSRKNAFSGTDKFAFHDSESGEMKYSYWNNMISRMWDSIVPKVEESSVYSAYSVYSDAGGMAYLPEDYSDGDGILALQSDIAAALLNYLTREDTETYVQGYAQKKGSYLMPSDLANHNTDKTAHNDIRLLIEGLTARLNALADSDDTTLDQLSEVVEYIKANRGLIESVTTSKISVSDIIDNLTTNVTNKPLSAAQGVALKALIDAITVPTKLSELSGDSTHRTVTDAEKAAWNAKSNFSGKYADLDGKPTIPTVPTKVSAFENDAGYVTDDKTISITGVDENGNTHTWTVYGVKS